MSFSNGPKGIIGDGLVYTIDAANPQSYNSGSGVTYDFFNQTLSGSLDGNGTTYSTDGIGSFEFDGTDDYIEFPSLDVLSAFFPPSLMSTPLPDIQVEMITDFFEPAFAIISASLSWFFAFRTIWFIFFLLNISE